MPRTTAPTSRTKTPPIDPVRARQGPRGVAVARGDPVVPEEPDHREPQDETAEQREDAAQPEAPGALGQALAVVPDAGEPGQAVVEGDHHAEGGHRVADDAAAARQVVHGHVEHDGDGAHGDRRHRRGEEALVHPAERAPGSPCRPPSTSVVRAVGRIVVCVEAAAELSTISRSSLVMNHADPRRAEDRGPEHVEHVARVGWGCRRPMPVGADAGVGLRGHDDEGVGGQQDEVESTAARPGIRCESLVSSLTETAVSQPQ